MIIIYALALLLAMLCIVASARLLHAGEFRLEHDIIYRREGAPESATGGGPVTPANPDEMAQSRELTEAAAKMNAPVSAGIKRLLDIAFSLSLLVFLAPLLLVTAALIKLDSPGPILYRQKRVGYGGRVFEVYKFRSMITNAEANGPQYAAVKDSRITRVGHVIRKFRIDEIPQAINVLRGEMSFVGPRPERPEFVLELEQEIPLYHCRHLIKPGITGWAQVKYEYAASVEGARNKLRYDLYYMRHFSPLLDLMIVLMTVRVALFGLGSR
ncbi:exopolysaccharide biosynthesis polyprenyl glycosylphosphotransferase [Hyphococcus sp. DH-69]|uniref:exopolysaccharide biosynthesis polyprenyl glycosylphosphotransferase n=1 Tax=Hyphococcus formosus TaxID=3143534 RepID=UPI00398BA7EE